MKKLLAILGSSTLGTSGVLTVVSCDNKVNYDNLFDDTEENNNHGEYIKPGLEASLAKFERAVQQTILLKTPVGQRRGKDLKQINQKLATERETNILALTTHLKAACDFTQSGFVIEINDDNSFTTPVINGFDSTNFSGDEISVTNGTAYVSLKYLNTVVATKTVSWSIPEFELLSEVTNLLNMNGYDKVGAYKAAKLDIPLFNLGSLGVPLKITLGTISGIISLLDLLHADADANNNPIVDLLKPVVEPIQRIARLDVNALTKKDINGFDGVIAYGVFDTEFRRAMQQLFEGIKTLLAQFNLSDEITLPDNGSGIEQKIKITELLNANVFEILNFDTSSLNSTQEVSGLTVKINATIGSKGVGGQLKMIDLLANAAPNFVKLINKFLDPDTYNIAKGGSHNLIYLMLKELITDMDPDLLKLNEANNSDNKSAANAKSGLDSLLFNMLLDYNKSNRTPEKLNVYLHLKLVATVPVIGDLQIFNDSLYQLTNKIMINPGEIVLKIINNLFDLKGQQSIDFKTPFLSPDLNMSFLESEDIDMQAIIDDMDTSDFNKQALSAFSGTLKSSITDNVNKQINALIPEMTMQKLVAIDPKAMLRELKVPEKYLDSASITMEDAKFVFQFYNPVEQTWNNVTRGISYRTFEIYTSMKIKFTEVRFKIYFETPENAVFEYFTKQNLTFDIVFADTDTKR